MFEELRMFLVDNATNEEYDLVTDAFDIFIDYYPPTLREAFMDLLFVQDESLIDTGNILDRILGLTHFYLTNLLKDHSIILNEDVSLARLTDIVQALLAIEHYEDIDTIKNILQLDIDDIEKLAEILALNGEMDTGEITLELESVDHSLIERIKDYTNQSIKIVLTKIDVARSDTDQLMRVKAFIGEASSYLLNLVSDGLGIGYALDSYLKLIATHLQTLPIKEAAREFFIATQISSDAVGNAKAALSTHIDKLFHDFRVKTQMDIELTNITLAYQIFKDKGIKNG